jgi:hypothetical protein
MIQKNKLLLIFLFLMGNYSCQIGRKDDNPVTKHLWEINQIIDYPGVYYSCESNLFLQIKIEDNLVKFKLFDKTGNILFESSEPSISNVHSWFFLIDQSGVVWIESSDIGLYLAKRDSSGKYLLEGFGEINDKNVYDIPEKVYSSLPECLRKDFPR